MTDIEHKFWELCDIAKRHDDAYSLKLGDNSVSPDEAALEAQSYEQAMVDIIKLVEANPAQRQMFVRCFSDIVLWKRTAPYCLVAYCMRHLRFPEIQELIRHDAEAHQGTAYYADHMNYWSDINQAYLDKA